MLSRNRETARGLCSLRRGPDADPTLSSAGCSALVCCAAAPKQPASSSTLWECLLACEVAPSAAGLPCEVSKTPLAALSDEDVASCSRLSLESCRSSLDLRRSNRRSSAAGVAARAAPPGRTAAAAKSPPAGSLLYCANADMREEPRRDADVCWSGCGSSAGRGWLTERSVAASAAASSSSAPESSPDAVAARSGSRPRRWPRWWLASPLPERPARGAPPPPLLEAGRLVLLDCGPEALAPAA